MYSKLIFERIDFATANYSFTGSFVEIKEEFEDNVLALSLDNTTSTIAKNIMISSINMGHLMQIV